MTPPYDHPYNVFGGLPIKHTHQVIQNNNFDFNKIPTG